MRDAAAIRTTIATIVTSAGALQTLIHETAIECLQHAEATGDSTIIDHLVKALPQGQRVEALITWVEAFSPIRWGAEQKVGLLKKEAKLYVPFDLVTAAATPYYSFTKEKKVQVLSLEALMNIVGGLSTRIEKAVANGTIKDGEDVDQMAAYAARLAGVNAPTKVVAPDLTVVENDTPTDDGKVPTLDDAADVEPVLTIDEDTGVMAVNEANA